MKMSLHGRQAMRPARGFVLLLSDFVPQLVDLVGNALQLQEHVQLDDGKGDDRAPRRR